MTAKYFTGADGDLLVGGVKVAKIRNWSIDGSVESLETTNTGDEAKTYIYGRQSYKGRCTAFYYTDASSGLPMSSLLENIYRTDGTSATAVSDLILRLSLNRQIRANVLFTSASTSVGAGDVATVDLAFTVNGHLVDASLGGA